MPFSSPAVDPQTVDALRARWGTGIAYLAAVALFGTAFLLRRALLPGESGLPFITFYPGTIIAFYFLGMGPGWLMVLLSAVGGYYYFSPPFGSFEPSRVSVVGTGIFLGGAALTAAVVARFQRAAESLAVTLDRLAVSEQRYQAILADQSELIIRWRADDTVLFVNDAFCRFFGVHKRKLAGSKWHPMVLPEDLPKVEARLGALSAAAPLVTIEHRVIGAGAAVRWCEFIHRGIFDGDGNLVEIQAVGRDIDGRKALEAKLAKHSEELDDLFEHAPCGYHALSEEGLVLRMNATELQWLGRAREEVVGRMHMWELLTAEGKDQFHRNFPLLKATGRIHDLEIDLVSKSGEVRRVSVTASVVRDINGRFLQTRSVLHDITASRQQRERIEFIAFHDALTGLYNRQALHDQMTQALALAERSHRSVAVCFVDLDGFKPVNDRHGHALGDRILKQVAERLQEIVRPYDAICRYGGDEFVLLLANLESDQEYELALARVLDEIGRPIRIDHELSVSVTASIGVALYPSDSKDPASLLRLADEAMYEAKTAGRNRYLRIISDGVRSVPVAEQKLERRH